MILKSLKDWGCYQSQNYKIWKQFTTPKRRLNKLTRMLSITKLQNLKAIHNHKVVNIDGVEDVINHKITKFESNSQHHFSQKERGFRCYQSQNYKIWKQFTTHKHTPPSRYSMLSITKLQNLKAIHNDLDKWMPLWWDVINHKITKFESNSQQAVCGVQTALWCYQSQNYKIWKQFTTISGCVNVAFKMLSITKLQNLKAIHNHCAISVCHGVDVINHKITKFESNSQL